jgi:hypothetical protein
MSSRYYGCQWTRTISNRSRAASTWSWKSTMSRTRIYSNILSLPMDSSRKAWMAEAECSCTGQLRLSIPLISVPCFDHNLSAISWHFASSASSQKVHLVRNRPFPIVHHMVVHAAKFRVWNSDVMHARATGSIFVQWSRDA